MGLNTTHSDTNSSKLLETLLRVTANEMSDQLAYSGIRAMFGLVLRSSLYIALGPFALILHLADLAALLTKIGISTYIEVENDRIRSTAYSLHISNSGTLVAESMDKTSLKNFPFALPESLQIPSTRLWSTPSIVSDFDPKAGDYREVFSGINTTKSLFAFNCPDCRQMVELTKGTWIGHAPFCIFSPTKAMLTSLERATCTECKNRIVWINGLQEGHDRDCSYNPRKSLLSNPSPPSSDFVCSECNGKIILLGNEWFGHTTNCSWNILPRLS